MRSLWALCALLFFGVSTAASSTGGLVFNFDVDAEVRLAAPPSAIARLAAPRTFEGPAWTAAATGATTWTRTFPAPRAFDADPGRAISFSVAVPPVAPGDLLTIRDERGRVRWQRRVDATLLAAAARNGADIERHSAAAYEATKRLSHANPAQTIARRPGDATPAIRRRLPPIGTPARPLADVAAPKSAAETFAVTGSVVDAESPIIVRAFDAASGRFVQSTEQQWWTQTFELPLAAGTYVFEVDDNLEYIDSDFFYRRPTQTGPVRIDADTHLPDIHRDPAAGEFSLLARMPCSLLAQAAYVPAYFDVWATSADGAHIIRSAHQDASTLPSQTGNLCDVRYVAELSPGHYAIEASPIGWEPRRFDDVEIVDGQRTEISETFESSDRTQVWRGTVVDTENQPVSDAFVILHDDLQEDTAFVPLVSGAGEFEIPYRRNWIADFQLFRPSMRHLQVFDGSALPSRVVMDDLAFGSTLDDGLLRLYGDGDRNRRYNILFLAEGFTDVAETFTDSNGNGQWDGFVWYDADHDGAYSDADLLGLRGDIYAFPQTGDDPVALSEPFDDLNGDGVLSVEDPALFLADARGFLLALFGSDFWDKHRDAFNAYAFFEPSREAGYAVVSASGETLLARDTLYGASLDETRGLLSIDRAKAMQHALAVLPEVDLVVVLVNQSLFLGARANTTVSQPGSMVYPADMAGVYTSDMTPAHEMAHFIASLCDEYAEFAGVAPGPTTSFPCPNATHSTDPADIPWAAWLAPGFTAPSRNLDVSPGLYEGADYYPGGAYRPSYSSIMRDLTSPLYNAPSRAALEAAVMHRTGFRPRGHSSHARPGAGGTSSGR